jgi:hypothetical protein
MTPVWARLLSIPHREVTFAHRRFRPCEPSVQQRIEAYFGSFLDGYHLALASTSPIELGTQLDNHVEPELRGFAYEGAGMYLALLDGLTPWRRDRLRCFTAGPANRYAMITIIGAGLAYARLPWMRWSGRMMSHHLDLEVGWLAVDGFGFHEGFFDHVRAIDHARQPERLDGYAGRCFDHGLGRSIWFVEGASPERIARAIGRFPTSRQPDLWAGVGLACAYAGGVYANLDLYADVLDALAQFARHFVAHLRVGIIFAAVARYEASAHSPWTALACERLLGYTLKDAARLGLRAGDEIRAQLVHTPNARGYEQTRDLILGAVGG